jgi:hypothetical protein
LLNKRFQFFAIIIETIENHNKLSKLSFKNYFKLLKIYFQCDEAIYENGKNEYKITERTKSSEQSEDSKNKKDPEDPLNIVENSGFKCELVKEGEKEEDTEEESISGTEKSPSHTSQSSVFFCTFSKNDIWSQGTGANISPADSGASFSI